MIFVIRRVDAWRIENVPMRRWKLGKDVGYAVVFVVLGHDEFDGI